MNRFLRWLIALVCCSMVLSCTPPSTLPAPIDTAITPTRASIEPTRQQEPEDTATPPEESPTEEAAPLPDISMVEYIDPDGFFQMAYPEGWLEHPTRGNMQFWEDETASVGLAVAVQIKAVSAGALADSFTNRQQETLQDYIELERSEVEINGHPAILVMRLWTEGEDTIQSLLVTLARNRVGLLAQAWAPEERWSEVESRFWAAVYSLAFTEYVEAPLYDTWAQAETEHLVLYYPPDTWVAEVIDDIAVQHEDAYQAIRQALNLETEEPVTLYLYPSEDTLYRSTARASGFAITATKEVHALWIAADDHQTPGHELTHILTSIEWGEPAEALLGEGIAVCLDQSGRDPHAQAAELLRQGELAALTRMLGDSWFTIDAGIAYPESGSFAWFLLDTYGVDAFRELYQAVELKPALIEVTGKSLSQLEKAWKQVLATYE
ncbi:MAG: hypothetical protein ACYCZF_06780 [Anaerolineae bacterium]